MGSSNMCSLKMRASVQMVSNSLSKSRDTMAVICLMCMLVGVLLAILQS